MSKEKETKETEVKVDQAVEAALPTGKANFDIAMVSKRVKELSFKISELLKADTEANNPDGQMSIVDVLIMTSALGVVSDGLFAVAEKTMGDGTISKEADSKLN